MQAIFNFGSNNPQRLKERLGRTIPLDSIVKAKILGYKRHFTNSKHSRDKGGVATLIPSTISDDVLGYVTYLTENELQILDKFEGVSTGKYERKQFQVLIYNQSSVRKLNVIAYVMTDAFMKNKTIGYLQPSDEYLRHVLATIHAGGWMKKGGHLFLLEHIPLH